MRVVRSKTWTGKLFSLMKIAVLSDSHDHLENIECALRQLTELGAEALLFLGDFCAPFSLHLMAEKFSEGPIHVVFGNNDGDAFLLCRVASSFSHVQLHGHYAELSMGDRRIAIFHYPDVARRIAESGQLDAVFSGHDHQTYIHRFGKTLWANPGEVMGRYGKASFGIYDSIAHDFTHHLIAP